MRRSSDFLEAGNSNKLTHLRENAEWNPPPSCTAALSSTAPLAQYSVIMVEEGWQVVGGENHCGWGRPPATGDKEETCLSYQGQRWQSGVGGHRAEKGDGREKPQNGSGGEENLN